MSNYIETFFNANIDRIVERAVFHMTLANPIPTIRSDDDEYLSRFLPQLKYKFTEWARGITPAVIRFYTAYYSHKQVYEDEVESILIIAVVRILKGLVYKEAYIKQLSNTLNSPGQTNYAELLNSGVLTESWHAIESKRANNAPSGNYRRDDGVSLDVRSNIVSRQDNQILQRPPINNGVAPNHVLLRNPELITLINNGLNNSIFTEELILKALKEINMRKENHRGVVIEPPVVHVRSEPTGIIKHNNAAKTKTKILSLKFDTTTIIPMKNLTKERAMRDGNRVVVKGENDVYIPLQGRLNNQAMNLINGLASEKLTFSKLFSLLEALEEIEHTKPVLCVIKKRINNITEMFFKYRHRAVLEFENASGLKNSLLLTNTLNYTTKDEKTLMDTLIIAETSDEEIVTDLENVVLTSLRLLFSQNTLCVLEGGEYVAASDIDVVETDALNLNEDERVVLHLVEYRKTLLLPSTVLAWSPILNRVLLCDEDGEKETDYQSVIDENSLFKMLDSVLSDNTVMSKESEHLLYCDVIDSTASSFRVYRYGGHSTNVEQKLVIVKYDNTI